MTEMRTYVTNGSGKQEDFAGSSEFNLAVTELSFCSDGLSCTCSYLLAKEDKNP